MIAATVFSSHFSDFLSTFAPRLHPLLTSLSVAFINSFIAYLISAETAIIKFLPLKRV